MTDVNALAHYYESILPDKARFIEYGHLPLPTTAWVNTLKISVEEAWSHLQQEGVEAERLPWCEAALSVKGDVSLGKSWLYKAGLIQIQEAVSMLPPLLLAVQPGQRVLDLCAAPGNKTAQLAVKMKNQGTLVANDRSFARLRALSQISKRLGLVNISSSAYDGTRFPKVNGYFDAVLVDVPCTCEGTFRKTRQKQIEPNRLQSLNMSRLQKQLLSKAILSCRPGGRIAYSTCTFAPEENEAVIDWALREYGHEIAIEPIELAGFAFSEGVVQWQGETYLPQVRHALRAWPHQNNTGGFFVALLRKKAAKKECVTLPAQFEIADQAQVDSHLKQQQARFQFQDALLDQFCYHTNSVRGMYFYNADNHPPAAMHCDATGMFFLKTKIRFPKLSTAAAMLLAPMANKNVIDLTRVQLKAYYLNEEFVIDEMQRQQCSDMGYVLLRYQQQGVGQGIYFPSRDNQPHRVRSLLPKFLKDPA